MLQLKSLNPTESTEWIVLDQILHCHSQVLEFLQGLLRREHIDQMDDLQAERQAISPLCYSPIYIHFTVES